MWYYGLGCTPALSNNKHCWWHLFNLKVSEPFKIHELKYRPIKPNKNCVIDIIPSYCTVYYAQAQRTQAQGVKVLLQVTLCYRFWSVTFFLQENIVALHTEKSPDISDINDGWMSLNCSNVTITSYGSLRNLKRKGVIANIINTCVFSTMTSMNICCKNSLLRMETSQESR